MKDHKRLFILLLVFCITLPLVLCGCKTNENDESKTSASSADTSTDTFAADFKAATGLDVKDWGGQTVKFITFTNDEGYFNREIAPTQVKAEDYSGEYVYDAVCERTEIMREKFGINVECHFPPTGDTPSKVVENEILGGTQEYQILSETLLRSAELGLNNRLYDISVLGIDTTKSFWDQTAIDDLSICGHLFYLTGDIVVSDDQSTWCCFFNKDLINEYHLENPYELVADNKWTVDKVNEMGKVYSEYNTSLSDLTWETGHYGLVAQTYDGLTSMAGCNQRMISKDASENPVLDLRSDSIVNKFDKVYNLLTDKFNCILAEKIDNWQNNPYLKANSIFYDGRALFQYQKVQYVLTLADHDVNFGIVPMPKYNSEQEYYNTTCTVYWSLFMSVPKSVDSAQFPLIGYTLQAMSYLGQKYLTPAYYEVTIKSQKVRDDESEDMLDKIFSHRVYELAAAYNFAEGLQLYTSCLASATNIFVSKSESVEGTINKSISDTIEALGAVTNTK